MDTRLVKLDQDHPGFRDQLYRQRRDYIANIALSHRTDLPVPKAPYTEDEHSVWRAVRRLLTPLHRKWVCRELNLVQDVLGLDEYRIPQFDTVNRRLMSHSGFRMTPVAGLVTPRTFLEQLAGRVFLSTQYIRHHSRPLYTPEPDVIHELIGHAASLIDKDIVDLSLAFGRAALRADEKAINKLIRVFWYTLEFGAVEEEGQVKALGAGLLSSAGELAQFSHKAELRPWNVDVIAETPFDPTDYQPHIFIAPSFAKLVSDLGAWLNRMYPQAYAPETPPPALPLAGMWTQTVHRHQKRGASNSTAPR